MKLRLPHKLQAALIATLAAAAFTTLSSATAFAQDTPTTFNGDAGKALFMGDSITHGVLDASYRWQLFKTFVDNGVEFDIQGPISGYNSTPADSDNRGGAATYRMKGFVNSHYAKASGRSYEMINGTSRYNNISTTTLGQTDFDTYSLLIGTNDLLSDSGYTYDNFKTKMQNLLGGTVSYSGTGADAEWSWEPGDTPGGNLNTILGDLKLNQGDRFFVLSVPVWSTHSNNNDATIHAAVAGYNKLLQQWVERYNATSVASVQYVNLNEGMLDHTSTTPFFGNKSFFNNGSDGLHPSEQGSLIMAGNVARTMGIGGRTAGLQRAAATGEGWSAAESPITLSAGAAAQTVTGAEFTEADGYTVEFTATFGNGSTDGWLDADKDRPASGVAKVTTFSTLTNSLNITVGDGTHTGTLKLAEGYVAWDCGTAGGDMVLYCQDNSVSGNEALRIAYRAEDATNNILGGYYVWKGDMLIGQGLTALDGSVNGIQVSITGNASTGGTVSGISWANTAYAPSTELFSQEPLPNHDNENRSTLGIDFTTGSTSYTGQYASGANADKVVQTSVTSTSWFAPVGANHSEGIAVEYKGITGPKNNMFGIVVSSGSIAESGNVSVVIDGGSTLNSGEYDSSGAFSIFGSYQGTIAQKLSIEIDEATLTKGVLMGVVKGTNSIGGVDLRINSGAIIGGDVIGGNHSAGGTIDGDVDITITGGSIVGSVYGGNMDRGTISGNTNVMITGGIISGGVFGGNKTGGTIGGTTSVTVDGYLPSIGGDIVADTVTLQNVAPDSQHSDTFDKYRGRITANTVVLDKYTVERLLASVETQSLVLSGGSKTTVSNLTLTACDITVEDGSELTLEGVNTYGNTTTYSGHVAIADYTTFSLHTATMTGEASGYSDGKNGFAMGTMIVLNPLAEGNSLYTTTGDVLTAENTATFSGGGILTGATFNYDATTGQLTAEALGTGGPFFVNEGTVVYRAGTNVYTADDIRLNGGTLQFQETLKDGTALSVIKTGSGIIVDNGVSMAVNRVDAASLAEFGVTLTGTMTASTRDELLANFSGTDANITTTASITLNNNDATHAGGVLTIGDSLSLNLNGAKGNTYSISSFRQVVLGAGSTINYQAKSATFNNVTLANGDASISITDMGATTDMLTLAGETKLNGHKLSISAPGTSWKRYVTIEKLVGDDASTLSFEGGKTSDNSGSKITINSLQGFSGTLELKENRTDNPLTAVVKTGSGSNVKLAGVNLAGTGEVLELTAQTALNLGTVSVANDSEIKFHGTPTQQITIEKLAGDAAEKTLKVYSMDQTNNGDAHHIVLGAADADYTSGLFNGTLWVTSNSNQGSSARSTVDAYLVAQDVLRDTTLKLDNWASGYNNTRISLSLGTDAKVAGINSANTGKYSGWGAYIRSGQLTVAQPNGVNDFVSSASNAYTLEITGSGNYTTNAYIMGKVNLAMSGTGTQTFSGDMSQFNGSINVTNGTLALTPAASSISTHDVHVGENGTLSISATATDTTITAFGTMYNAGSLTLTGAVVLNPADITAFEKLASSPDPVYSGEGDYAGSGYLTTSAHYYLVKGGENSTLNNYITDITGGSIVSQDTKNIVVAFETSDTRPGTYYVNSALNYNATEMGNATDFIIAPNATLNSDGSSYAGAPKVLHGKGTYALANNTSALNEGLSLGTDWTGTVRISGVSFGGNMNPINNLANSNSWVELVGVHGWFDNSTINANLILGEDANGWGYYQDNGANNKVLTINGVVKGTGKFGRSNTTGQHQTHVFTNDISGWTGTYEARSADDRSTTLRLTNNAHEVNATLTRMSGVFNVDVQTDVAFSKAITATTLAVTAGHTATLGADATLGGLTGAGNIASTANITLNGGSGTAYELGGAITGAHLLNKTGAGTQTINGPVTVDRFTIGAGTTTFNGLVTGTGAGYTGTNRRMSVSGGTVYFNDGFAYTGDDSYALVTSGGTTHFGGISDLSGKSIGAGSGSAIVLDAGASLKLNELMNSTTSGSNGTLEMNSGSVLTLAGRMYLTGATSEGGTIHMGNNASVNLHAGSYQPIMEFGLGAVVLDGANATIQTLNHGGTVKLDSISGTGTLTLKANSGSTARNTFSIGGSATESELTKFHGTLALERVGTGANRVLLAEFNDKYSAADAVVQATLSGNHSSEAVGILINSDVVQMKGLKDGTNITSVSSYALASGSASALADTANAGAATYLDNASDGTSRTLEIVGDGEYTTAIKVLSGVNLTMSGAGSQTFNGDLSAMNGTVTATGGTLTLNNTGSSRGTLASVTYNGGTLVLNNMNVAGTTTIGEGTTLDLGATNLTSAIVNHGTVNFTQNITSSGLDKEGEDVSYRVGADDNRATNDNYFLEGTRTESTLRVVTGGTVNPAGHTVTQDNVAYALKADGTATGVSADTVDYGTFYQGEAGSTLQSSLITTTAEAHKKLTVGVVVDRANLIVDSALYFVQVADANITNTVETDNIPVLQIAGGDNTLVGSVRSLPEMTLFVKGAAGSLKMQNATATPYQMNAGSDITFADNGSVTVRAAVAEEGSEQFDVYSLNNARFTVEANTMQAMNTGNVTVNNHLKVVSIATGGAGSLTLANGVEETLKNVTALNGDITFLNMAEARGTTSGEQTQVGLDSLYIGSSKTVSFYENGIVDAAQEASVTVSGTLTAGSGAQLNANLEMASGSTLDVSADGGVNGLLMGSTVTLNKGMNLEDYSSEWSTWEDGTKYALFSGVDGLSIGASMGTEAIDYTQWVDAKEYFTNIEEANRYFLCYDGAPADNQNGVLQASFNGSNVGMVYIMVMPEPTTGTLSLLALCALAARRRRK